MDTNVAVFFTLNRISLDCARSFFARITIKDVPTFTCLFSMTFLSFHRVGKWRGGGGHGTVSSLQCQCINLDRATRRFR